MLSKPIGIWFAFDQKHKLMSIWSLDCGVERDAWILKMVVNGACTIYYRVIEF